ncbi:MAG: amidotransferase, partial [Gammaproteobacteria bacterium]|nr:amidotransferase [Gammaproteobacteria bacterium]
IGWFSLSIKNPEKLPAVLEDVFPETVEVFHWHGDTFEIPESAVHFASSEACNNQAFVLNDRVIGLQFHIETTESSAKLLVENCREELDGSVFVQSEEEILGDSNRFNIINQTLPRLLKKIVEYANT